MAALTLQTCLTRPKHRSGRALFWSVGVQVGVSIPSTVYAWNSRPSVQRITLRNTFANQQRALRVLYPPGNDTVLDITLSAAAGSNASMLSHPWLGLNITVNAVALPELIQLSGGQQAVDRLNTLLQQALGLSDIDVGVELLASQDPGSTTLRVAVPWTKVCQHACCHALRGSEVLQPYCAPSAAGICLVCLPSC